MLNSRWTRCAPRASGTQIFLCSLQKMKVPRILRQRSTRKHRKGPQPGQQPAGLLEACWAGLWDLERRRFPGSVRLMWEGPIFSRSPGSAGGGRFVGYTGGGSGVGIAEKKGSAAKGGAKKG